MTDFPWLTALIALPLVGAFVTAFLPRGTALPRQVALAVSGLTLVGAVVVAVGYDAGGGMQFVEQQEWIAVFGANYALGVDGLGLLMILLTAVLVPIVLVASSRHADEVGLFDAPGAAAFSAWVLALEALSIAVFAATDVFLFYVVFEATLIPAYFLIGGFGRPGRSRAAVKFLIYQLAGGLVMLASVIGLYVVSARAGHPSYLISDLAALDIDETSQRWLFAGFFIAFAIKAPLFPVHTWLADTTEKATTGTSVLLVCVLDKIGTFGMLRFCLGLFPEASEWATPVVVVLALISIVYGALVAIGQDDILRLIGLTSLSHFGLIVLGIFVFSSEGSSGAILYMVNHGLATALLFLVAGFLIRRTGTPLMSRMHGGRREGRAGARRLVPDRRPRHLRTARSLAVRLGDPGPDLGVRLRVVGRNDRGDRDRARGDLRAVDVPTDDDRAARTGDRGLHGPRPARDERGRPAGAGAGAVRLLPHADARRDQPDGRHHPRAGGRQ